MVDDTGDLTQEELHILSGWTLRLDSGSSGSISTHSIENKGTLNGGW